MLVEKLSLQIDAAQSLKNLGVDSGGVKILASKMKHHLISIKNLHVGAANILKQDALSIGADLAVPKGTVIAMHQRVDVLLIANQKQLLALSRKELAQPFGLKELAHELKRFASAHRPTPVQVMGVINANDDSFYQASRFRDTDALEAVIDMMEAGADIIDIGAVSSRPGSLEVTAEEELLRIKPIIDALYANKLYEKTILSIDSYTPDVIAYALERGFSIVNDITGLSDDAVARLSAEYKARVIMMHMQGTPKTMQEDPHYDSVLSEITAFFEVRLEKAEKFGIKDIILDVGIGFGKTLKHNLALITHLEHFLKLGHPLLIGASRKSMIDKISGSSLAEERLGGTLAIHLKAVENGAEIVRVHDVKEHVQALKVAEALRLSIN
ncbi:MAG: dihydropteroate synthase [Epsilonproteobacteria bacterium]|nr:MAG: dihydropteroate synthase [Campylobacterota bacterium]